MGTRRGFMAMGVAGAAGLALLGSTRKAVAAVPARALALPTKPAVLLLGDSYTEGVGAVPKTNGFANADNSHPNNAGHGLLRSLFVRDVQQLTGF